MILSQCLAAVWIVSLARSCVFAEQESNKNAQDIDCGLYMAESSIPNAGWGIYTGIPLLKGAVIKPLDVVVQFADYNRQQKYRNQYLQLDEPLPLWLMYEYYWNSQTTMAWHDAKFVQSIVPGLGMLANSHPGLVNAREEGPKWKQSVARSVPEAGAYSQYKNTTFRTNQDVPAGHELLVKYGDSWFEAREYAFGENIPLSGDYEEADEIMDQASNFCNNALETPFCQDLWKLVKHDLLNVTNSRIYSALPNVFTKQVLESGTAKHSVPNVIRSMDYLQENGVCLDHLEMRSTSSIPQAGSGAFASRTLPKGTIVAPAPVVHMHRGHLDIFFPDSHDEEQFHWQGHQLLLNYVYGHPSTSLVFFPYSPAVNLINHSLEPNVELRWSARMAHAEWLNRTTDELISQNKHAGLSMELVAIRDIAKGEEVVLNYGSDWQQAWEHHVQNWPKPMDSDTHRPVEAFQKLKKLPTRADLNNDDMEQLPGNAMTVCWVDWDEVEETDEPNTFVWLPDTETADQTDTRVCNLLSRTKVNGKYHYTAQLRYGKQIYIIKDMLRRAIDVVDRPYAANQFLRQSFRHEIQLPDVMIPDAWKDREVADESCGLYMAESSISNSGLGMFTGKVVKDSHLIAFPEIVIQALDIDENNELRRWYVGADDDSEAPWLLENYYWNPPYTAASSEARDVESIVPGIGMLANSHTGAFNALSRRPFRDNAGLRVQTDPGAGASTTYHGMQYRAFNGDIAAGAEIFVEYGDHWFLDQEERLGVIPLSEDFADADVLLLAFWDKIGGGPHNETAKEKWKEFLQEVQETEELRVYLALPQKLADVEGVLDTGTARYSARDSIKPMEWLEKNGRCLDNMKPAVSSIPQAGRGAFATRHISKGDIVAPAPLVQLNHNQMEMMDAHDLDNPKSKIWRVRSQLLKNYCFGHQNSSILLYPYSPVVNYINHDRENYNAELRWSELPNHQSAWLNQSVDELIELDHAGLIMEFIAIRDISRGEEILIDYGERWQNAWDEHVKSWKPDPSYKRYTPAWELNDYTLPVRTHAEQAIRPYPENVWIGCYLGPVDEEQSGSIVDGSLEYKWTYRPNMYHTTLDVTECQILERYKDYIETADSIRPVDERYKVQVWKHRQMAWVISDVPRRAIEFFDKQYTSELKLSNAFRHEMDLPNHMVPDAWTDREMVDHDESDDDDDDEEESHSTVDEL